MKFKKILSATLATVMAASVLSVGMVSVASAATATITELTDGKTVSTAEESDLKGTVKEKEADLDYVCYFSETPYTDTSNPNIEISLTGGQHGSKNSGQMFGGKGTAYTGAGVKSPEITITLKTPGKLYIDYCGGGKNRYALINDSIQTGKTGENDVGIQTSFSADATTYTLKKGDSDIYVYAIGYKSSDGPAVYWPKEDTPTQSKTSWLGGEPKVLYDNENGLQGTAAVHNVSVDTTHHRIRLGDAAYGAKDGTADNPVTIAKCGYISFTETGNFNVSITAASSGETSPRTFYVGTVTGGDGSEEFTDIATLNVKGNVPQTVSAAIQGEGEKTYAIYVKPQYRASQEAPDDGILDPADNTDITAIDILPADAVQSKTPEITLADATVADGKITVNASISDFSTELYEIDTITLNAALGKDSQELATWTANDIKELTANDNQGGKAVVQFTAEGTAPNEDARFQAIAHYKGIEGTLASGTDANAVSNLLKYIFTAPAA